MTCGLTVVYLPRRGTCILFVYYLCIRCIFGTRFEVGRSCMCVFRPVHVFLPGGGPPAALQ